MKSESGISLAIASQPFPYLVYAGVVQGPKINAVLPFLLSFFHFLFVDAVIQGYRLYFVAEFLGDGFGEAAMLSKCVHNFTAFNTLCSNAIGC